MTRVDRILVATDFSDCGDRAFDVAVGWACRQGAELHLVHAVEYITNSIGSTTEPVIVDYIEQARQRASQRLHELAARARESSLETIVHVIDAPVAEGIARLSVDRAIDAIVVGSHGHKGLSHMWFGSVAERIVRLAPCPVLVARGERSPLDPGTVVVGDDLTPAGKGVREMAIDFARPSDAKLVVVHSLALGIPYLSTVEVVVPNDIFDNCYARALEQLEEDAESTPEVEIENVVVSDRAAREIRERAEQNNAGLVIVGSHARKGFERLVLGSVAEKVVRRATCSVLVVHRHATD